jgi:hypothetical protein
MSLKIQADDAVTHRIENQLSLLAERGVAGMLVLKRRGTWLRCCSTIGSLISASAATYHVVIL